MFQTIDTLIKELKYAVALDELNKFSDEIKKDIPFIKKIAYVALRCNNSTLSKQFYDKIFHYKKEDLRTYLDYSQILIKAKEFDQASELLIKSLKYYPNNISLLRSSIIVAKAEKKSTIELSFCQQLIKLDSNTKHYHLLIDALLRSKSYKMADQELSNAVLKFGEAEFIFLKIKLYTSLEKWEEILVLYEKALEINSTKHTIYIGAFRILDCLNRHEEAIEWLKKGLKKSDNKKNIEETLASYYIRCKQAKNAIDHLEHLIDIDAYNIKHYQKLATIFNNQQNYIESLKVLTDAENIFQSQGIETKEMFEIHLIRSKIYKATHNWQACVMELNSALDIKPFDSEVNLILAQMKMKQHYFHRADEILNRILIIDPAYKNASIYLQENIRLQSLRTLELERYYNLFSNLKPITVADHIAQSDFKAEYIGVKESLKITIESLNIYKNNPALLSRIIIYSLQLNKLFDVQYYWNILLEKHIFSIEFLYLVRQMHIYCNIEEKNLQKLLEVTNNRINTYLKSKYKSSNQSITKIAILGGSNSVIKDGWAPSFSKNMKSIAGITVDNYGLGGISSLFGLALALDKKLFKQYDVVIFEYTLNDIFFNQHKGYDHALLAGVISGITAQAEKHASKLVFLLMSPFDNFNNVTTSECAITQIYQNEAKTKASSYFSITQLILDAKYTSTFISSLYRDNMHYSSQFAQNIADVFTLELLQNSFEFDNSKQIKKNILRNIIDTSALHFIEPSIFKINGGSKYILRETNIISRKFLSIDKNAFISLIIPKGSRVIGVLINSSENTGYIKITFNDEIFIKNIFADRPIGDPIKARIYLKQFTRPLISYNDNSVLTLSAHVTQSDLDRLPLDVTVYSQLPRVSFEKQELEISGVLVI